MTLNQFEDAVKGLLAEVAAMTLATCKGGLPWATDIYFAPDGYDLFFFSSPDSRHCLNLVLNPACAASVHPVATSWREIRGLQMEGTAGLVNSVKGKARAFMAYFGKFPFARELMSSPSEAGPKIGKVTAHIFRPSRIRYLDNSLGFGTRFCVLLEAGTPIGPPEREGGV